MKKIFKVINLRKFSVNLIIYLIIILISFSYGYFVKRNEIFPYKILKEIFGHKTLGYILQENAKKESWYKKMISEKLNKIIIINDYKEGYYFFNDRLYTNSVNEKKIIGKTLIQISRHREKNIALNLKEDAMIYRILCKDNDNDHYKDWLNAEYELMINAISCNHKKVIKKFFKKGVIELKSGGPNSADPILIDLKSNNSLNLVK